MFQLSGNTSSGPNCLSDVKLSINQPAHWPSYVATFVKLNIFSYSIYCTCNSFFIDLYSNTRQLLSLTITNVLLVIRRTKISPFFCHLSTLLFNFHKKCGIKWTEQPHEKKKQIEKISVISRLIITHKNNQSRCDKRPSQIAKKSDVIPLQRFLFWLIFDKIPQVGKCVSPDYWYGGVSPQPRTTGYVRPQGSIGHHIRTAEAGDSSSECKDGVGMTDTTWTRYLN